jgi:regulator of cell morphogenesis and NO signaling
MSVTVQSTVGELVTERPSRSRIFESFGIDFCCGGKQTLAEACEKRNLDPQIVINILQQFDDQSSTKNDERDWSKAPLSELCDHIEHTHHAHMRQELPRLDVNLQKIAAKHGPHNPRLVELLDVFHALRAEYEQHALKEERILFPLIRLMEAGDLQAGSHCGSINNPIRVMMMEHDHAGDALKRMRELTGGFAAPDDACNTYRATMDALRELERDLHRHVHKENSILFPRAAELEAGVGV